MIILDDGYVLTLAESGAQGWLSVAVHGDRIAGVGSAEEMRTRFPAAEHQSCAGRIVMPGLINAHLHPELIVLKGMVEQLDLHAWTDHDHFDPCLDLLALPRN